MINLEIFDNNDVLIDMIENIMYNTHNIETNKLIYNTLNENNFLIKYNEQIVLNFKRILEYDKEFYIDIIYMFLNVYVTTGLESESHLIVDNDNLDNFNIGQYDLGNVNLNNDSIPSVGIHIPLYKETFWYKSLKRHNIIIDDDVQYIDFGVYDTLDIDTNTLISMVDDLLVSTMVSTSNQYDWYSELNPILNSVVLYLKSKKIILDV